VVRVCCVCAGGCILCVCVGVCVVCVGGYGVCFVCEWCVCVCGVCVGVCGVCVVCLCVGLCVWGIWVYEVYGSYCMCKGDRNLSLSTHLHPRFTENPRAFKGTFFSLCPYGFTVVVLLNDTNT